jgi:hypothetical protein
MKNPPKKFTQGILNLSWALRKNGRYGQPKMSPPIWFIY